MFIDRKTLQMVAQQKLAALTFTPCQPFAGGSLSWVA